MSETTNISIVKTTNDSVLVKISSFRDDILPNTNLQNENIAITGFVIFINSVFYENNIARKLIQELQDTLNKSPLDIYFSQKTTSKFIKNAKITHLNPTLDFRPSDLDLRSEQVQQLYKYMEYDPEVGDYEIDEDFNIDIFKHGDRGNKV